MIDPIQILKAIWAFITTHPYLSIPIVYSLFLIFRWYFAKRLGRTAIFAKMKDLNPEVFFGTKYQDFYYERTTDGEIKDSLDNKQTVLITGIPMAGKTRAAYEAMKKFSDHYILHPYPARLKDLDLSDYRFWPIFRDWLRPWKKIKVILFLNDLPDYTKSINPKEDIDRLQSLTNFLKGTTDSLVVVTTSRSQAVDELRKDARDFLDRFNEVKLGKISDSDKQEIERHVKEPSGEFDGTIGSIILGKERMKHCLVSRGEKAQAIMWSIGLLSKARIIPPEEGLVTTVCERIFKQTLNPVTFNNLVIGLISDGLILKNHLLPGHPSYVEENFLDKGLSIYFTALKEILKDRRRTEELYGLADAFYFNKNYPEAVSIWDFVLSEIDPKDATAWFGKGVTLELLGEKDEAEQCFKRAKELGFEPPSKK